VLGHGSLGAQAWYHLVLGHGSPEGSGMGSLTGALGHGSPTRGRSGMGLVNGSLGHGWHTA
jgi:hypothetical protein